MTRTEAGAGVRAMTPADYDGVAALLGGIAGVRLRGADSREGIAKYLERNPGHSFVAEAGGRVVGCLLAGHDGRRGYLYHLAVAPEARRRGTGRALVERALEALRTAGIEKVHADVLPENEDGLAFWLRRGWHRRDDILRISWVAPDNPNA